MTIELELLATSSSLRVTRLAAPRVALDEVLRCSQRELGTAAWWSCLATRLDRLRDEMAQCDIAGLAAQVTADAPQYAAKARRLPALDLAVQERAREMRMRVAELAGSRSAAPAVAAEVGDLLRKVRQLYTLSDQLLLDAYERDLGGE